MSTQAKKAPKEWTTWRGAGQVGLFVLGTLIGWAPVGTAWSTYDSLGPMWLALVVVVVAAVAVTVLWRQYALASGMVLSALFNAIVLASLSSGPQIS